MFRILFKFSAMIALLANLLLFGYVATLFFPVLPATGIKFHPDLDGFNPKYLSLLGSTKVWTLILINLLISACFGFLCPIFGILFGYISRHRYRGKFVFLVFLSYLLFLPEFLTFLTNAPFFTAVLGKEATRIATYGSGLSFGMALSMLLAYSYLQRLNETEVETIISLGGTQMNVVLNYLMPRAKNFILSVGTFLSIVFLHQGFYTFQSTKAKAASPYYQVIEPWLYRIDPGPGSALFLIYLFISLVGCMIILHYFNLEYSLSTPGVAKGGKSRARKKRVTRKGPPKKKEKKKKKKKEEPIPDEAQQPGEEEPKSDEADQTTNETSQSSDQDTVETQNDSDGTATSEGEEGTAIEESPAAEETESPLEKEAKDTPEEEKDKEGGSS